MLRQLPCHESQSMTVISYFKFCLDKCFLLTIYHLLAEYLIYSSAAMELVPQFLYTTSIKSN